MAVAYADVFRSVFGHKRVALITATFSGTYTTGGEVASASALGFKSVDAVFVSNSTTRLVVYNASTAKLQAFDPSPGGAYAQSAALVELPNASATTETAQLLVFGI